MERSALPGCIINTLPQAISKGRDGVGWGAEGGEGGWGEGVGLVVVDLRGLGCPGLTLWDLQLVEGGAASKGAQGQGLALSDSSGDWPVPAGSP